MMSLDPLDAKQTPKIDKCQVFKAFFEQKVVYLLWVGNLFGPREQKIQDIVQSIETFSLFGVFLKKMFILYFHFEPFQIFDQIILNVVYSLV